MSDYITIKVDTHELSVCAVEMRDGKPALVKDTKTIKANYVSKAMARAQFPNVPRGTDIVDVVVSSEKYRVERVTFESHAVTLDKFKPGYITRSVGGMILHAYFPCQQPDGSMGIGEHTLEVKASTMTDAKARTLFKKHGFKHPSGTMYTWDGDGEKRLIGMPLGEFLSIAERVGDDAQVTEDGQTELALFE